MTSARLLAVLLGLACLAAQAHVDAMPGHPLSDDVSLVVGELCPDR